MVRRFIFGTLAFMDKCKEDKINAYAAQAAFFIILSFIPFLMVFSSLLQYTPITAQQMMDTIARIVPDSLTANVMSVVEEVYSRPVALISVTAILAIWSAAKGMQYITDGLNSVNDLEETRNWLVLRIWAVLYTIVFMIVILFALFVGVFGEQLHRLANQSVSTLRPMLGILHVGRGLGMFAILILIFCVMFMALPNRKLTFKGQIPGAMLCALGWYVISFGLSIYVEYFNGFSMYGSLTTIALVMLWIYFCMYTMLLAAEVNVVFHERIVIWLRVRKRKKEIKKM